MLNLFIFTCKKEYNRTVPSDPQVKKRLRWKGEHSTF